MSEAPASTGNRQAAPLLPQGAVLLHIGFHKTGTTAIQDAFTAARAELPGHGITYPGSMRQHHWAAFAFLDRTFGWKQRGGRRPDPTYWPALRREVAAATGRVVVSSEFFSESDATQARELVDALGSGRVHVVATLRGLHKLLPSSWQQNVKNGFRYEYGEWLEGILADPPNPKITPSFWLRHRHAAVLQRWADIVGPGRVTLVVLDDSDRSMLYRTFEEMLGLPRRYLEDQPRERENRSLTMAESELVRRLNVEILKAEDAKWSDYHRFIREGAVRRLVERRTPSEDEPRIVTPAWALDRAAEISKQTAEDIRASGIRVIGDLDTLADVPPSSVTEIVTPTAVPMDAAVESLLGTFEAKRVRGKGRRRRPGRKARPAAAPAPLTVRRVVGALRRRAVRRLRRT